LHALSIITSVFSVAVFIRHSGGLVLSCLVMFSSELSGTSIMLNCAVFLGRMVSDMECLLVA